MEVHLISKYRRVSKKLNVISFTATKNYNCTCADFHLAAFCADTVLQTKFRPYRAPNEKVVSELIIL
jgi:hypothetical protein